jgi:hypothetical protein
MMGDALKRWKEYQAKIAQDRADLEAKAEKFKADQAAWTPPPPPPPPPAGQPPAVELPPEYVAPEQLPYSEPQPMAPDAAMAPPPAAPQIPEYNAPGSFGAFKREVGKVPGAIPGMAKAAIEDVGTAAMLAGRIGVGAGNFVINTATGLMDLPGDVVDLGKRAASAVAEKDRQILQQAADARIRQAGGIPQSDYAGTVDLPIEYDPRDPIGEAREAFTAELHNQMMDYAVKTGLVNENGKLDMSREIYEGARGSVVPTFIHLTMEEMKKGYDAASGTDGVPEYNQSMEMVEALIAEGLVEPRTGYRMLGTLIGVASDMFATRRAAGLSTNLMKLRGAAQSAWGAKRATMVENVLESLPGDIVRAAAREDEGLGMVALGAGAGALMGRAMPHALTGKAEQEALRAELRAAGKEAEAAAVARGPLTAPPRKLEDIMVDQQVYPQNAPGLRPDEIPGPDVPPRPRAAPAAPAEAFPPADPQAFKEAADAAAATGKGGADALTTHTAEEYGAMKSVRLSPDGKTGVAVKQDGEIVTLFNQGGRGMGGKALDQAIADGGTKLEAFDGPLVEMYSKKGFREVSREANWEAGGPDVVKMQLPDQTPMTRESFFASGKRDPIGKLKPAVDLGEGRSITFKGGAHNIDELEEIDPIMAKRVDDTWEETGKDPMGFTDENGEFYTREEAGQWRNTKGESSFIADSYVKEEKGLPGLLDEAPAGSPLKAPGQRAAPAAPSRKALEDERAALERYTNEDDVGDFDYAPGESPRDKAYARMEEIDRELAPAVAEEAAPVVQKATVEMTLPQRRVAAVAGIKAKDLKDITPEQALALRRKLEDARMVGRADANVRARLAEKLKKIHEDGGLDYAEAAAKAETARLDDVAKVLDETPAAPTKVPAAAPQQVAEAEAPALPPRPKLKMTKTKNFDMDGTWVVHLPDGSKRRMFNSQASSEGGLGRVWRDSVRKEKGGTEWGARPGMRGGQRLGYNKEEALDEIWRQYHAEGKGAKAAAKKVAAEAEPAAVKAKPKAMVEAKVAPVKKAAKTLDLEDEAKFRDVSDAERITAYEAEGLSHADAIKANKLVTDDFYTPKEALESFPKTAKKALDDQIKTNAKKGGIVVKPQVKPGKGKNAGGFLVPELMQLGQKLAMRSTAGGTVGATLTLALSGENENTTWQDKVRTGFIGGALLAMGANGVNMYAKSLGGRQLLTGGGRMVGTAKYLAGDEASLLIRRAWQKLGGGAAAGDRQIQQAAGDLLSAVRKEYKVGPTRFGGVVAKDNPFENIPEPIQNAIKDFMNGDPNALIAGNVPQGIADAVINMRAGIDQYSKFMIDEGMVDGKLAKKFGDEMGAYLTRSYQIWDDEAWGTAINKHGIWSPPPRSGLDEAEWNGVVNRFKQWYYDQALSTSGKNLTVDELNDAVQVFMSRGAKEDSPLTFLSSGKLGKLNTKILAKRNNKLPTEVRELWGEHKDPWLNYVRTLSRQASYVSNYRFMKNVAVGGEKYDLLAKAGEDFMPDGSVGHLIPASDKKWGALAGRRVNKDFFEAMNEQINNPTEIVGMVMKVPLMLSSWSKVAKTVGSWTTHVRNTLGNGSFAVANGYSPKDMAKMGYTSFGDILVANGFKPGSATRKETVNKLVTLGVIDDNANGVELDKLLQMLRKQTPDQVYENSTRNAAGRFLKGQVFGTAQAAYRAEDDLWKIVSFNIERRRILQALPGMSADAADEYAATVVSNVFPTFSLTPQIVNATRRYGGFISFPAEVYRTTKGTIDQIKKEITHSNPAIKKIGYTRLAGSLSYIGALSGAGAASAAFFNVSKEEEDAVRTVTMPWNENSTLLWLKPVEDGKYGYLDLSSWFPHSYMKDPLNAMLRGEKWENNLKETVQELASPFLSTSPLVGELMKTYSSRNKEPGALPYMEAVQKGLLPSVWDQSMRLLTSRSSGDTVLDRKVEAAANVFGVRGSFGDARDNARYALRTMGYALSASDSKLKKAEEAGAVPIPFVTARTMRALGLGELSIDMLVERIGKRNTDILLETAEQVNAALMAGVPNDEILGWFSEYKVPKDYLDYLLSYIGAGSRKNTLNPFK